MTHSETNSQAHPHRDELQPILDAVFAKTAAYLEELDSLPVRTAHTEAAAEAFDGPLPDVGHGASRTLEELIRQGSPGMLNSGGPRFYHFVMGGSTPAALGADWLATLFDQVAYAWVTSPLTVRLEAVSIRWLRELFGLPSQGGGILTTGATMANYVCLAAARQWWGDRHGFDAATDGLSGKPQMPVFSSGYVHASTVKAVGMLGIGRCHVRTFSRDKRGRVDLDAMEQALSELDGAPAVIVANAGEVNAGDFDPINDLADLAQRYHAWLHVDGAFGLFARLSPQTAHLAAGVERAHSVTVDGHKWLNVPYDCGFALVNDITLLARSFGYTADYLPGPDDPRPNMGALGPESSRRGRSLAVWATLKAYGRGGYRSMIERHLDLARHLGELVDAAPELERLAEVQLNIVCFRYNPGDRSDSELDTLNHRLGEALFQDGRFFVGTTRFEGRTALRPAMVNWRTEREHIEEFVRVVREVAAGL